MTVGIFVDMQSRVFGRKKGREMDREIGKRSRKKDKENLGETPGDIDEGDLGLPRKMPRNAAAQPGGKRPKTGTRPGQDWLC